MCLAGSANPPNSPEPSQTPQNQTLRAGRVRQKLGELGGLEFSIKRVARHRPLLLDQFRLDRIALMVDEVADGLRQLDIEPPDDVRLFGDEAALAQRSTQASRAPFALAARLRPRDEQLVHLA